jgi:hypothetical protein
VTGLSWEGDQKPDAAEWHSDMTYRPGAPFASIIKAVEVPPPLVATHCGQTRSPFTTLSTPGCGATSSRSKPSTTWVPFAPVPPKPGAMRVLAQRC